jgi:hypothetical protein
MIDSELQKEVFRNDCFLCRPNSRLLIDVSPWGYSLAGLGPMVVGYSVIATHQHVIGLKELSRTDLENYCSYAISVADILSKKHGRCLILEHGNMAVCGIDSADRAHCFHPHFLLVPNDKCNTGPFDEYFKENKKWFKTLFEAVEYGAQQGQYVLAGTVSAGFNIYLPDGEVPRQFARGVVSEQLGLADKASWKDAPDLLLALANADELRLIFAKK